MKILVVRNDKLGDFMLAYPTIALLNNAFPDASIQVLVPEYTRTMAHICPGVTEVIVDPGKAAGWRGVITLATRLRRQRFDAAIVLFSTMRIAWALLLAGIPHRLAPATKLVQVLYNQRVVQRRSRSEKPEYGYNLDLAKAFVRRHKLEPSPDPGPPYLAFPDTEIADLRAALGGECGISDAAKIVFIHPGSGGSANNLSLGQYTQLAATISRAVDCHMVITAGPRELAMARQLEQQCTGLGVAATVYESTQGLVAFAKRVACADLFISGSTGPLHIAGALDRPTAAFYPRRRSSTLLRWQTLNSPERRSAFAPPDDAGESDMSAIDITAAAHEIVASHFS